MSSIEIKLIVKLINVSFYKRIIKYKNFFRLVLAPTIDKNYSIYYSSSSSNRVFISKISFGVLSLLSS